MLLLINSYQKQYNTKIKETDPKGNQICSSLLQIYLFFTYINNNFLLGSS